MKHGAQLMILLVLLSSAAAWAAPARSEDDFDHLPAPEVTAKLRTLVTIEDGRMKAVSGIDYYVANAQVKVLSVSLPKNSRILDVEGDSITASDSREQGDRVRVDLKLKRPVQGSYKLIVEYESVMDQGAKEAPVPILLVEDAESYDGVVAVASTYELEINERAVENLREVDPMALSESMFEFRDNLILKAYAFQGIMNSTRIPRLVFSLVHHEDVEVQVGFIDEARFLTLVQDNGFSVTTAVFSVRNKGRQHLRITLPPDSEIWSASLGDRPVSVKRDDQGRILVPLPRSDIGEKGEHLNLPIEVVYKSPVEPIKKKGELTVLLPKPDLYIGKADWMLFLPRGREYMEFRGAFDRIVAKTATEDSALELRKFTDLLGGTFFKMLAKSKQSEAKTNLGSIFTGQVAHHGQFGEYGRTFEEIAWAPEGQNKYTYYMGEDVIKAFNGYSKNSDFKLDRVIEGTMVGRNGFWAVAVANMDNDPFPDIWAINQDKQLVNLANDVNDTYSNDYEKLIQEGLFVDPSKFRFNHAIDEQISRAELRGMLGLRIDVPTTGQYFRLERVFPGAQGEDLKLEVTYRKPSLKLEFNKLWALRGVLAFAFGLIVIGQVRRKNDGRKLPQKIFSRWAIYFLLIWAALEIIVF